MKKECRHAHAFADGQLSDDEAAAFREHFPGCPRCLEQLETIFALKGLAETTDAVATAAPVTAQLPRVERRWRPRWWWLGLAGAGLAAAGVIALYPRVPPGPWAAASTRPIEARLALADGDGYRPYNQLRGGAGEVADVDFTAMERLRQRGDVRGLASRWLWAKDVARARAVLAAAPASAPLDGERAVLALLEGKQEAALAFLDRAIVREPASPSARWNRALALRDLGLSATAGAAFGQMADAGQPGWSEEARSWAASLGRQSEERKRRWQAANAAAEALAATGRLPPAELVGPFADLLRGGLYEALRAAQSPAEVDALAPLARQLDAHYGGTALAAALARTRAGDLPRRAPLARAYAEWRKRSWKEPAPGAFASYLAELRRAGARELLFGALTAPGAPVPELAELESAAAAEPDPYLALVARTKVIEARPDGERDRLFAAAGDEASRHELTYLRLYFQVRRAYVLLKQRRLGEAGRLLGELRTAAHASGYWNHEMVALFQLAGLASRRQEGAAVKAYAEEVLRSEDSCQLRVAMAELLAERATNDGRPEEARWAFGEVRACEPRKYLRLAGLSALSELARLGDGRDLAAFEEALAAVRPRIKPSEHLLAVALEGRARIGFDRTEGRRLLEQVQQMTDGADRASPDPSRLLASRRLIADAVAAGDPARALALLAQESELDVPAGCVVALAEDMRRPIAVSRGADGRLLGALGPRSATTMPQDLEDALPPEQRRALRGCAEVAVLALPPFYGRPRLLGAEVPWRHYAGHARPPRWTDERRLVVSDVTPPRELELPTLPAWQPPDGATIHRHLQGAEATTREVARAMREADLVELHVHGLFDPSKQDDPFLVLSPDERGQALLTAADVRKLELPRKPFVILAACNSATSSPYFPSYSGRWSLPAAFLAAGASGVLAASSPIPDLAARAFIAALEEKLRSQTPPALALRDVRLRWLEQHPADQWVYDIVLYQ